MAGQRRYWVVSPNVKQSERTVAAWKKEIRLAPASIMGWGPDDYGHRQQGPKFAGKTQNSIQPDDIVLVARRHNWKPDVVGFGVVNGLYRAGCLPPSDDDVHLRDLNPFIRWSSSPKDVPILDVLQYTRTLVQLHPEKSNAHRAVCDWMVLQLGLGDGEVGSEETPISTTKVRTTNITESDLEESTFGYKVKTKSKVTEARKAEAELVRDYKRWLEKKERKLVRLTFNRLQCDAWEEERKNLIEAKGSTRREDIRMAVGELLDYAFQMQEEWNGPNMAILLPRKPATARIDWLPCGINVIWRSGRSFRDNAKGHFT